MEKHEVLRACGADIDEWMSLVERVKDNFPGLETPEALEQYRETALRNMERGSALCVRVDGRMAGILLYSKKQGCLSCMAVLPEYRCAGVGSALVRQMLDDMGEREIWVDTFREDDPLGKAPRAMYKKFGFEEGELCVDQGYPVQRFYRRKGGETT